MNLSICTFRLYSSYGYASPGSLSTVRLHYRFSTFMLEWMPFTTVSHREPLLVQYIPLRMGLWWTDSVHPFENRVRSADARTILFVLCFCVASLGIGKNSHNKLLHIYWANKVSCNKLVQADKFTLRNFRCRPVLSQKICDAIACVCIYNLSWYTS